MERTTKLSYLMQLSWETSPTSSARQIKNKYERAKYNEKRSTTAVNRYRLHGLLH